MKLTIAFAQPKYYVKNIHNIIFLIDQVLLDVMTKIETLAFTGHRQQIQLPLECDLQSTRTQSFSPDGNV